MTSPITRYRIALARLYDAAWDHDEVAADAARTELYAALEAGAGRRDPWLACTDCGLPYSDDGWMDAVVPDEVWLRIYGSEGGVLCISCMARRCVRLDIEVPVKITSGPFAP